MTDYVFLAAQAYGDNVISLRMLDELPGDLRLRVLGTRLTHEIAGLIGFRRFPVSVLPQGMLAVYNVRADGPVRAGRDFLTLARALRGMVRHGTVVLFENQRRPGTHRLLHLAAGRFRYLEPSPGQSAYDDRRKMLERALGIDIPLPRARAPAPGLGKVVIAPAARKGFRAFPDQTVADLLDYFARRRSETCLVDARGAYGHLRGRAAQYLAQRPLAESVAELTRSDLVIAPDSLFLHLAYALGVPAIALVPPLIAKSFYFAPPGLVEQGLSLSFESATEATGLFAHLDRVLAA